jgi:hypothetical protein
LSHSMILLQDHHEQPVIGTHNPDHE